MQVTKGNLAHARTVCTRLSSSSPAQEPGNEARAMGTPRSVQVSFNCDMLAAHSVDPALPKIVKSSVGSGK